MILLSYADLVIASLLILALAGLSAAARLNLGRALLIAGLRTAVQLLLVGLVLKAVFSAGEPLWVALMMFVMLLVAVREVVARQGQRFTGMWAVNLGLFPMLLSSFTLTLFALVVIIENHPWHEPQYAIPLLGMLLGNTMNGVALSMDRLTQSAWQQQAVIEGRLMLGDTATVAIRHIARDSARIGMIPMINAMAAAGIVSLPGMMTGQILAGIEPMEAVKYQILIMFLITASTGLATFMAVIWGARRLFDGRQRLRLERIQPPAKNGRRRP